MHSQQEFTEIPIDTQGESLYRLVVAPHLLSVEKDRLDVYRPAGGSVADILKSLGWTRDSLHARVIIDGRVIPEARWEYTVPAPRQSVCIRAIPMDSRGQGKDALRIAATITVIVGAIATGGLVATAIGAGASFIGLSATTWGGIAAAGVSITGSARTLDLLPLRRIGR